MTNQFTNFRLAKYDGVEVPALPAEPPLPPPGTGMPTDAEIEAVKATVRYRLDHLWFDPCAGIYPPGGNEAVLEAVKPIRDLQARVNAEIARIQGEEAEAVAEWYAKEAYYDEINREFGKLNINYFREYIKEIYDAFKVAISCPDGLGVRVYKTLGDLRAGIILYKGYVYDFLTPEQKALVDKWGATFVKSYLHPVCSYFSWAAYNAAKSAFAEAQAIGREYQARWKPLIRVHDELRMDYWYCGIPLGY